MARNPIISARTARDIDGRIERGLRGLGHPEPPLRLEDVREMLELDRVFYTADDPGVVRDRHRFYFETFFNRYDALTLGRYLRPEIRVLAVAG